MYSPYNLQLIFLISRLRHYPTLASLQFQNPVVRLMIAMYFGGSMIYLTFYNNSEMYWFMVIIKGLSSKENLQMVGELSLSIILKNMFDVLGFAYRIIYS